MSETVDPVATLGEDPQHGEALLELLVRAHVLQLGARLAVLDDEV